MKSNKQIFVGGSGRCGTTLMKRIVCRHSQIAGLPREGRFIIDPGGLIDLVDALSTNWSPHVADAAILRFETLMKQRLYLSPGKQVLRLLGRAASGLANVDLRIPYLFTHLGEVWSQEVYFEIVERFLDKLQHKRYSGRWLGSPVGTYQICLARRFSRPEIVALAAEFIDDLFYHAAHQKRKSSWCEHTPFNCLHANSLYELFPRMKLLYMYRDPRDVVSSFLTRRWAPGDPSDAAIWLKQILECWENIKDSIPQSAYIEIRFEDLMSDPPGVVKQACEFLEVPFEPEMVTLDLSKHHTGRWKRDLTEKQAKEVSRHLRPFIEWHGD